MQWTYRVNGENKRAGDERLLRVLDLGLAVPLWCSLARNKYGHAKRCQS
jgi:hypothetical protein